MRIFPIFKKAGVQECVLEDSRGTFSIVFDSDEFLTALVDESSLVTHAGNVREEISNESNAALSHIQGLELSSSEINQLLEEIEFIDIVWDDSILELIEPSVIDLNLISRENLELINLHNFEVQFPTDTIFAITEEPQIDFSGYGESNPELIDAFQTSIQATEDIAVLSEIGKSEVTLNQGATTATSTGAQAWPNPANAQGKKDSTVATIADNSPVAAVNGTLILDPYPDPISDLSNYTVQSVKVRYFAQLAHGAVAGATLSLDWRVGTEPYVNLETIGPTGGSAFNSLTTPKIFDITGDRAWTWEDLNSFNIRVVFSSTPAGVNNNASIDAIELEIIATKSPA